MKFEELFALSDLDLVAEDVGGYTLPAADSSISTSAQLEVAIRQFSAARRALGLVNKLAAGPTKQRNASRVLAVLNKIRANIRRIEKQIAVEISDGPI